MRIHSTTTDSTPSPTCYALRLPSLARIAGVLCKTEHRREACNPSQFHRVARIDHVQHENAFGHSPQANSWMTSRLCDKPSVCDAPNARAEPRLTAGGRSGSEGSQRSSVRSISWLGAFFSSMPMSRCSTFECGSAIASLEIRAGTCRRPIFTRRFSPQPACIRRNCFMRIHSTATDSTPSPTCHALRLPSLARITSVLCKTKHRREACNPDQVHRVARFDHVQHKQYFWHSSPAYSWMTSRLRDELIVCNAPNALLTCA